MDFHQQHDRIWPLVQEKSQWPASVITKMNFGIRLKVKYSRYRPVVAQRVDKGIALLFDERGTRRGEWSAALADRTLPPG